MLKLNLLVIRCKDIHLSKTFYETFGICFVEEQHGNNPIHFAAKIDGMIFELYPLMKHEVVENMRLGFISSTADKRVVLTDPDGRKVEVLPK